MKTWTASRNVSVTGRRKLRRGLGGTFVALLFFPIAALGFTAQAAAGAGSTRQTTQLAQATGPNPPADAGSKLPGVTIDATKQRQALRLEANEFVTSVVVQSSGKPIYRWTKRICPRVEGVPENLGEFILERISKAATDAEAPLAGRHCSPNLFVIASVDPDQTLNDWQARDQGMFKNGGPDEHVDDFLHSTLPIRAWYNSYNGCSDDSMPSAGATMALGGLSMGVGSSGGCADYQATRIGQGTAADIVQAIVVIDLRQTKNISNLQVADYIALVSLAEVRLDLDRTPVPSILELFAQGTPPQGLTSWDRALLYSLYNTDHLSAMEAQDMEITMVKRIAP